MTASLSIDDRFLNDRACSECGVEFVHVTGYVLDAGGESFAVYYLLPHTHGDERALLDVSLGTWGLDRVERTRVTFGCELSDAGPKLKDAPTTLDRTPPILGEPLARDAAGAHPWLEDFLRVVNLVVAEDPTLDETAS